MNTTTTHWTLELAIATIRGLNPKLAQVGYCVALTGSVLFKGESAKDLDLVLFPLKGNNTPYTPALETVRHHFNGVTLYGVDMIPSHDGKAVFTINHSAGQRVDVFIPHVESLKRTDHFANLNAHYQDV